VLTAPGCSLNAAQARALPGAQTSFPVTNGKPFGVVVSPDGKFVFAATATTLEVFGTSAPGLTLTHLFSFQIPGPATGMTITHNGQDLLVAAGNGIEVLSVETAETDSGTLVLGTLTVPGVTGFGRAINVAVTPNDQYAFVTLQFRAQLAVFNLGNAITNGAFNSTSFQGSVPLADPVGMAMSPDGKWLYATSFAAQGNAQGKLSVLNVAQLEADPAHATIKQAPAGCGPARIAVSPDNKTVWVTARDSNFLLGFSAALLRSDPSHALVAKVQVGKSPIGLILVNGATRMIVADNDLQGSGANNLAIVNVTQALANKPGALIGYLPTGLSPHEIALVPGGQFVVISDNGSAQLQVVNVSKLP
jgi:DNA-binding beta-propeller fold protein YncE